jgi:trans-aconitate 2-methyltransferase
MVNQGGALAVQVPANNGSPLHQAVLRVSRQAEWRELMAGCADLITYHEADFYYDQLSAGSKRIDMWQTTYYHIMDSQQGLIDWYASTGLKSYLARLTSDSQKKLFQEQVLAACRPYYPQQQDQQILFPFNRLFFVACKE